ncbi:hypothetical protein KAW18_05045 [candidate division WOR-3 bacterium]|nr:hypothetical protein [candidate division WOR-3 bacterium]
MEIKGVDIKSVIGFVRKNFPERYDDWVNALPEDSREIISGKILHSYWYPYIEGFVQPLQKICEIFYDGNKEGSREEGRFSADNDLKGIYRIFIKVGSPNFIIKRAARIFQNYFQSGEFKVVESSPQRAVAHMVVPDLHELHEVNVAGYMERALELSGCSGVTVRITRSLFSGDSVTEFMAEWE